MRKQPLVEAKVWQAIAESVKERMAEGDGMWATCSGCHESIDGYSIGYLHSDVFGCTLGSGCRECGGIGAVWDTTDYAAMGDDYSRECMAPNYVPIVCDIGGGP